MKFTRYIAALGALLGITSGIEATTVSVKSLGMAGVAVAYPQDAFSPIWNPAGAVDVDTRLDLEVVGVYYTGFVRNTNSPVPGVNGNLRAYDRTQWFFTPDAGFNYNIGNNLSVGFATYIQDQHKTTFAEPIPILGTTPPGFEIVHHVSTAFAAYKLGCHNFGISLDYHIQRMKLDGFQRFDQFGLTVSPGHVTNNQYSYSNGVGVKLGWQWHVTDTLTVGLMWAPRNHMKRFRKYDGVIADHGAFPSPERIRAGLAWRFKPCATFGFDYEFINWKQIRVLNNKIPETELQLGLHPAGSKYGPGFGWRNQHFFRFGMDYAWSENLVLRIGFRHATATIRKSQTALNAVSNTVCSDFLTGGFTWYADCNNEISLFAAWGFHDRIQGRNAIPGFLGGGDTQLKEQIIAFGIQWGHTF